MVTKFKLIYKNNRIYRIVLFIIFLICFGGIAVSINMKEPSLEVAALSKWEYRSQLEQSYILSDIFLKTSLAFFVAGLLAFVGILQDDNVFRRESYNLLLGIGFSRNRLKRIVVLRYLPSFSIPALIGMLMTGLKGIPVVLILVGILLFVLVFESNKIGKIEVTKHRETVANKKEIKKQHILLRYLVTYWKQGGKLSLITAVFIFIGAFITSFVYNSVCNKQTFEKNFFVNNSSIDIEWNSYDSYIQNINALKESLVKKEAIFYMFLDEEVIINDYCVDAYISDSFKQIQTPMCISGRAPLYDNEISIGAVFAQSQGISVGDLVDVSVEGQQHSYLVTGLIQAADMGFDCELTYDGYKKLVPEYSKVNTCICFAKEYKTGELEQLMKEISRQYKMDIHSLENKEAQARQLYSSYKDTIICITVILAISVILVVRLFVKMIVQSRSNSMQAQFKLMHKMGFTRRFTKKLEHKITICYVLLGTFGGLLLCLSMNSLLNYIFSKIGMLQIDFDYPIGLIVAIALLQAFIVIIVRPKTEKGGEG